MTSMNWPRSVGSDAQHRGVRASRRAGRARGSTWSIGVDSRVDSSSASFTVRVSCGSIARIGSSKSLSKRLTRAPSR